MSRPLPARAEPLEVRRPGPAWSGSAARSRRQPADPDHIADRRSCGLRPHRLHRGAGPGRDQGRGATARPTRDLPDARRLWRRNRVAEYVSPPFSEYVKVILKVSYNRGADLMVCLAAVKAGSRDCGDGLAEVWTSSPVTASRRPAPMSSTAPVPTTTAGRRRPTVATPDGDHGRAWGAASTTAWRSSASMDRRPERRRHAGGRPHPHQGWRHRRGSAAGQPSSSPRPRPDTSTRRAGASSSTACSSTTSPCEFEDFVAADHNIATIAAAIQEAY